MIEQLKTVLLVLLVASSAFLTWQIWTYQPHYDYINPTEYVIHEGLAQRKEMNELVRPELIIYHYGEQSHTVSYPEMLQYRILHGQMSNWYFYNFRQVEQEDYGTWQSQIEENEGIEFVFQTGLPLQLIQDIFQIRTENVTLPLINRIWIFEDMNNEEVFAMFISEDDQQLVQARTSISLSELKNYLALGESRPDYRAVTFSEPQEEEVYSIYYLPTSPVEMTEYRYFYQRIPVENMIQYLFVDPTLARPIQDRSGGSFYTDGSRGLHYDQQQYAMYFFHPAAQYSQTDVLSDTYVQRSVQFVNQHKGFDSNYYLHRIERNEQEQKVLVEFRNYMGNYAIYSEAQENDQNVIQLEVQNDRVVGYYRPMFEIDQVINQFPRELPSGDQLLSSLEEEGILLSQVFSISLGYKLTIEEYYLNYVPHWVVELKNGERLFINKLKPKTEEEPSDELESN